MVKKLLFLGFVSLSSLNAEYNKLTPLMQAARNNAVQTITELLKNGADVNEHNGDDWVYGETALMVAAAQGDIATMHVLINASAEVNAVAWRDQPHAGKPVLRYAIDSGSLDAIALLIKSGAYVNNFTESGLMHHARDHANTRNLTLLSHAIQTHAPIVIIQELIKAGANVNEIACEGWSYWTPLMVAAYYGYTEAVQLLLAANADKTKINKRDGNRTALDYALEEGHQDIVKLLQ